MFSEGHVYYHYTYFCGGGRFLFWCKIFRYMIEKEQKAKRVYHRTKPASKSKVRAIRFDLDFGRVYKSTTKRKSIYK